MIAAVYQFEREIMLERQAEGITCAKQKGAYRGRKPKELTPELKLAMKGWSDGTLSAKDAFALVVYNEQLSIRNVMSMDIRKKGKK